MNPPVGRGSAIPVTGQCPRRGTGPPAPGRQPSGQLRPGGSQRKTVLNDLGAGVSTIMSPVDRLSGLFASGGGADYLGGPGRVAPHLLQAGALAAAAGAAPALVAAALLHDAGHLRGADPLADETELSGPGLVARTDHQH